MKRITKILTVTALLATLCTGIGVYASASFGSGVAAVAENVGMVKTGLVGERITFSDTDFKTALSLSDFESITITRLPSSTDGSLILGGRRVGEGKVIARKNIGSLIFLPASDGVTECSFGFKVNGGGYDGEIECTLKLVGRVNYAPKTEGGGSITVKTQADIPVWDKLEASDPEGDALSYIVISYPKHGTVTLAEGDMGKFCYTPEKGYTGTDQFTYVVRDEYGNYSYPAAVSLKISERMCDAEYIDMQGREEYGAAVAMTAMSVMCGSIVGDDRYFSPDTPVTRAEFVAMMMKSGGMRPDATLTSSFFDDDSEIPPSLKCYVATAQRSGLVNGDFEGGRLLFSPNDAITKYEAAKIMATLLGAGRDGEETVFTSEEAVPVWARCSVSAMCSLGVFQNDENTTATVTRADAASYFYRLIELY
jgi:hypothetical protein